MQIFHYKYVNKEQRRQTNDVAAQLSDSPLQEKLGVSKHCLIVFLLTLSYISQTQKLKQTFTDRAMILEHPYLKNEKAWADLSLYE